MAEAGNVNQDKAQSRHWVYINFRLPLIREELAQLKSDRQKVADQLRGATDKDKKGSKGSTELRKKYIYFGERAKILMQEKEWIVGEQKRLKAQRNKMGS